MVAAQRLHQLFTYSPETGEFRVKEVRRGSPAKVGDLCGTVRPDGYLVIRVDGKAYLSHRLAWLYMTGDWPAQEVDHKDRVRSNNAWSNLRASSSTLNKVNRITRKRKYHDLPKSVIPKRGRFQSKVTVGGKTKSLGVYDTPEEAHAAYLSMARSKYGQHLPEGELS